MSGIEGGLLFDFSSVIISLIASKSYKRLLLLFSPGSRETPQWQHLTLTFFLFTIFKKCVFFSSSHHILHILFFSFSFFITRFLDSSFFLRYGCLYCFIFLISYILLEYQLFLLVTIDFFQDFLYPKVVKRVLEKQFVLKAIANASKCSSKSIKKFFYEKFWRIWVGQIFHQNQKKLKKKGKKTILMEFNEVCCP